MTFLNKMLLQIPSLDQGWATLVGGALALIAGYLVYRSAMLSREDFQRREKEGDRRRKLNLFLKAEHMAYILMQVAPLQANVSRLTFSVVADDGSYLPGHLKSAEIRIPRPKQLEELWQSLSDFPPTAVYEIRAITQYFDAAEEYLGNVVDVPDGLKSPLVRFYDGIFQSALILSSLMQETELVRSYCKEHPERDRILYGDPDPSDSEHDR